MKVKELKKLLENCNEDLEITFIYKGDGIAFEESGGEILNVVQVSGNKIEDVFLVVE
jgi:hypothetical protein